MTSRCPRCDAAVERGASQCERCRLDLACPACSAPYINPTEDRFCAECGDRIVQPAEPAPQPAGAPPPVDGSQPSETLAADSRAARVRSIMNAPAPAGSPFRQSAREILTRLRSGRTQTSVARDLRGMPSSATRKMRRALRRSIPYSIADLYLKLGTALSERGDFDAASEAFLQALDEGSQDLEVLADFAHAAERSGATDVALVANLERALRDPGDASRLARHSERYLDEPVALAEGRWIVEEWYPLICDLLAPSKRVGCALLTARVYLYRGQDRRALSLLRELARDAPDVAAKAGRELLESDHLPDRLLSDDLPAHALRAEAYAAVGASKQALDEIDGALAATMRDADPAAEIPLHKLKADLLEGTRPRAAADALVAAGRLHNLMERHAEAIEVFERATRVDPSSALAFWYLADSRRLTAERPTWPFGDEHTIEAAHADWLAGMAITQPTRKHAWVHLSGALILETMARGSNPDGRFLWRAALETERALALDPTAPEAWAVAAAHHRMLLHPATARVTADAACEREPETSRAQIEHLMAHVDLTSPDIPALLEKYAKKLPEHRSWILAVQAYDALLRGDLDGARAACESSFSLAADDSFTWPHTLAALAAALGGDDEAAADHAKTVLRLTEPGGPADGIGIRDDRGLAALILGRRDEAGEIFSELLETYWVDRLQARACLACTRLLQGDARTAEREMTTFAGRAVQPAQVAFARLAIELAARLEPDAADGCETLQRLLDGSEERMRTRSFDAGEALEELSAVLAHGPTGDERSNVAWAARARILAEADRLEDAAEAYEWLLADGDEAGRASAREALVRVLREASSAAAERHDLAAVRAAQGRLVELGQSTEVEAAVALAAAYLAAGQLDEALAELDPLQASAAPALADAHRLRGDVLLVAGRRGDARAAYDEALRRAAAGSAPQLDVAPLEIRLALLDAHDEDLASAGRRLRQAMTALRGEVEVQAAGQQVIAECQRLQDLAGLPPAMDCALRALAQDPKLTPAQRRHLSAARFAALREREPKPATRMVWPLVVETDAGALDASSRGRAETFVNGLVPRLREDVLAKTGVRLPGVLVRSTNVLAAGSYRILFEEITYGSGSLGTHLCLDVPACRDRGIGGTEVAHLWTGERGLQLTREEATAATADGVQLLDPLQTLAWRLDGLVRVHLHRFVGLAEVEFQLHEWEMEGEAERYDLVRRALPGKRARVRLVALMRRLVRAHVAVDDLDAILRGIVDAPRDATLAELEEVTRERLLMSLPGAHDGRVRVEVPPEVERGFDCANASRTEAELDAAARALLHLLEERGLGAPGGFVLVSSAARCRQVIQRAMQRHLASVAVVSASELEAVALAAPIAPVLDLAVSR